MHRGYIKLFRKIRESIIWKRSFPLSYSGAWIDILCEVRHSDKPDRVLIGNTVIECKRGQSIKSQDTWAKRWGWDRSKVRRFFKLLVSEHMVELETTNKTTIITVCKYETYQDYRPSNDHQTTIKRPSNDHQMTTDNNDKNAKNEKNENITAVFDHWNSHKGKGWRSHNKISPEIKEAIFVRLKKYPVEDICQSIDNYALVLKGEDYTWSYAWGLREFLLRCRKDDRKEPQFYRWLPHNFTPETYVDAKKRGLLEMLENAANGQSKSD